MAVIPIPVVFGVGAAHRPREVFQSWNRDKHHAAVFWDEGKFLVRLPFP